MAAWKLGPALAAGCTIVLKPAEQTPLTALRLGELALEAGFPRGRPERRHRRRRDRRGARRPPGVDKIAFTGSTAVGREIGAKAGRALKRVTLELGGKSPNIILPDADLRPRSGARSRASTSTPARPATRARACSCQQGPVRRGRRRARRAAAKTRIGPGLDPDTQLGPLVSAEQQRARDAATSTQGRAEGAELVAGGERARGAGDGYFVEPTLFTRHLRRHRDRARGDLRPGARRPALRLARGGRRSAPTTPSTASPPASGRATSATRTGSPRCCGPARST